MSVVKLPGDDTYYGKCGKLLKFMYGTRYASQNWEALYADAHIHLGFEQGRASTCVFRHEGTGIVVVNHGDDFTALGHGKDLDWYRDDICKTMSTKVKGRLGPERDDLKSMRVLNRGIEWTAERGKL